MRSGFSSKAHTKAQIRLPISVPAANATHVEVLSRAQKKIIVSIILPEFTKLTKATGPENTGPERTPLGMLTQVPVNSPSRITLENNGKIRP